MIFFKKREFKKMPWSQMIPNRLIRLEMQKKVPKLGAIICLVNNILPNFL